MIISETLTLHDTLYKKVYSDAGKYIECDGVYYVDAIDLIDTVKEYKETERYIKEEPETVEDSLKRIKETTELIKETTELNTANIEYVAMMSGIDLEV